MAQYSNKKSNAKHRTTPARRSHNNKPLMLWVVLAFVSGYIVSWIYSPETLKAWLQPEKVTQKEVAKAAALPKPQFEFYTLLTQEKKARAPLKEATSKQVTPQAVVQKPPAEEKAVLSKYQYLVQLASFQREADAKQMKAALLLRGFDVQINTAKTAQGSVWYRVVVGPFVSQAAAQKTQADIASSEHISGIIRRMDA